MRYCILVLLLTSIVGRAQDVRAYRLAHEKDILNSLVEFLSIPNVSNDKANISIPLYLFTDVLRTAAIGIPMSVSQG